MLTVNVNLNTKNNARKYCTSTDESEILLEQCSLTGGRRSSLAI